MTAELIVRARIWAERDGVSVPSEIIFDLVDALEKATPRVLSTVAELDGLPHGSVIRCNVAGQVGLVIGTKAPHDFFMAGREGSLPAEGVALPATVLWVGGTDTL
jgi:hypothetical protein